MAVEKLASGRIYVRTPYTRTAAEDYVSLFTKSRLSEFERAQKDARDEAELQKLSYKAQLSAYGEKIKANERAQAKLADLRVRVMNKQIDDETARQELALTLGEKYASRQDTTARAAAATGTYTTGSTTKVSGGRGGGGRRPPRPGEVSDIAEEQITLSKEAADPLENPVGYVGEIRGKISSGFIPAQTPAEADAVRYRATNETIDADAAARIRKNPSMTYEEAYMLAEGSVLAELDNSGAADFSQSYGRVKDAQDAEEAGTGAPRKSRTDREVGFYKKNPNLPGAAVAVAAAVPKVPSRKSILDEIDQAARDIKAPELPGAPSGDAFTRGRSLYAQRFGPTVPIPDYAERNLTRTLLDLPPEMQAQIGKSYRDYLAQQEAEARRTPEKEAIVARVTDDAALAAPPVPAAAPEVVPPAAPAPEVAPSPAAPPAPVPEAPPVEPAEPRIAPPPAAPAPPPPPVEDPDTRALRQQAQASQLAREVAAKKAELQALVARQGARAADRGLVDGMFAGYDAIAEPQSGRMQAFMDAAPYMPMNPPPPEPGVRTLPQRTAPEQRAAPLVLPQVNTAEARKRALELAALGMKPEGELMQSTPAAPSTAMAAPKQAAKLDLKGPGPLAAKSPEDIGRETDAQVLAASELAALTKSLVDDEKFRERVLRSKPGEFAAKVYLANREANKTISATQNTVVDEYMGNTKDMKTALAVAYALDALNKPVAPVKALTK